VIHHSEFIEHLIAEGKIKLKKEHREKITYHDPCYLGRHNQVYDEPREALSATGFDIVEMEHNRSNSFCCSAGGAQMWKEEEPGEEAIRRVRFKEALDTETDTLCTACPFCLTMMRDAGKELESDLAIKDIAQLVAENLED
jgi:Fe-S oxidoreductase